jgi:glycosyltransferase involved in cell wall biosynthesis
MSDSEVSRLAASELSILMPVYEGTPAAHLELALSSLLDQSVPAGCVIVIQDGDLTEEHAHVLESARARDSAVRVLRPGRVGLVGALNAGVAASKTGWIARMDADDVAERDRLRLLLEAARHDEYDVIGSAMREFVDDPYDLGPVRDVPLTHTAITRAMRRLNPINHPTVLVRREALVAAGGYQPLPGLEDYFLWARMAACGARFCNRPEPLVRYRVDDGSFRRRGDWATVRAEFTMQRHLIRLGLIGPLEAAVNLVTRVTFRLLPPCLMRPAYTVVRATLRRGRVRQ